MLWKNVRHAVKLALTNVRVMARADVLVEKGVTIKYQETLDFGVMVTLQSGVYLYGSRSGKRVSIADHVVLAANAMVLGEGGVAIGAFTHLGPGAVITSQYGDARAPMATASPRVKTRPVRVGRGCWIGSRAVLMPGTVLGDECVVAPGAVVYGVFGDRVSLRGDPAREVVAASS